MKIVMLVLILFVGIFAGQAKSATLIAEYRFDNALNLGLDSSGFGNHATNASVTQGADRFSNPGAGSFNGTSSSLIKLGGLSGFTGLAPGFSYTAWINRSSSDSVFGGIVSQDPAGVTPTNRFLIDGMDTMLVNAGGPADFDTSSPVLANDRWIHLAMTADDTGVGNQVKLYLQGVLVASNMFGHDLLNSSTFDTFVGTGENGNVHRFQGLLDDVRIYEGVLSEREIVDIFDPKITIPEPSGIVLIGLSCVVLFRRKAFG